MNLYLNTILCGIYNQFDPICLMFNVILSSTVQYRIIYTQSLSLNDQYPSLTLGTHDDELHDEAAQI